LVDSCLYHGAVYLKDSLINYYIMIQSSVDHCLYRGDDGNDGTLVDVNHVFVGDDISLACRASVQPLCRDMRTCVYVCMCVCVYVCACRDAGRRNEPASNQDLIELHNR
jgi:hypothetical protein